MQTRAPAEALTVCKGGSFASPSGLSVVSPKVPSMDEADFVSLMETHGRVPLATLLEIAEDQVRRLAEHLEQQGALDEDEEAKALLAAIRIRLLTAKGRALNLHTLG